MLIIPKERIKESKIQYIYNNKIPEGYIRKEIIQSWIACKKAGLTNISKILTTDLKPEIICDEILDRVIEQIPTEISFFISDLSGVVFYKNVNVDSLVQINHLGEVHIGTSSFSIWNSNSIETNVSLTEHYFETFESFHSKTLFFKDKNFAITFFYLGNELIFLHSKIKETLITLMKSISQEKQEIYLPLEFILINGDEIRNKILTQIENNLRFIILIGEEANTVNYLTEVYYLKSISLRLKEIPSNLISEILDISLKTNKAISIYDADLLDDKCLEMLAMPRNNLKDNSKILTNNVVVLSTLNGNEEDIKKLVNRLTVDINDIIMIDKINKYKNYKENNDIKKTSKQNLSKEPKEQNISVEKENSFGTIDRNPKLMEKESAVDERKLEHIRLAFSGRAKKNNITKDDIEKKNNKEVKKISNQKNRQENKDHDNLEKETTKNKIHTDINDKKKIKSINNENKSKKNQNEKLTEENKKIKDQKKYISEESGLKENNNTTVNKKTKEITETKEKKDKSKAKKNISAYNETNASTENLYENDIGKDKIIDIDKQSYSQDIEKVKETLQMKNFKEIAKVLKSVNGDIKQSTKILGISRATLYRKITKLKEMGLYDKG